MPETTFAMFAPGLHIPATTEPSTQYGPFSGNAAGHREEEQRLGDHKTGGNISGYLHFGPVDELFRATITKAKLTLTPTQTDVVPLDVRVGLMDYDGVWHQGIDGGKDFYPGWMVGSAAIPSEIRDTGAVLIKDTDPAAGTLLTLPLDGVDVHDICIQMFETPAGGPFDASTIAVTGFRGVNGYEVTRFWVELWSTKARTSGPFTTPQVSNAHLELDSLLQATSTKLWSSWNIGSALLNTFTLPGAESLASSTMYAWVLRHDASAALIKAVGAPVAEIQIKTAATADNEPVGGANQRADWARGFSGGQYLYHLWRPHPSADSSDTIDTPGWLHGGEFINSDGFHTVPAFTTDVEQEWGEGYGGLDLTLTGFVAALQAFIDDPSFVPGRGIAIILDPKNVTNFEKFYHGALGGADVPTLVIEYVKVPGVAMHHGAIGAERVERRVVGEERVSAQARGEERVERGVAGGERVDYSVRSGERVERERSTS